MQNLFLKMSFYVLRLKKMQILFIYLKIFVECLLWLWGTSYPEVKIIDLISSRGKIKINYSNNHIVKRAIGTWKGTPALGLEAGTAFWSLWHLLPGKRGRALCWSAQVRVWHSWDAEKSLMSQRMRTGWVVAWDPDGEVDNACSYRPC